MARVKRQRVLIALGLVMVMGISVYLRLWTIDYRISSNDAELIRRQFDLANREAMDESAEWRRRYDLEFEKATKCSRELDEIKQSLIQKPGYSTALNQKIEMLQKENLDLRGKNENLKRDLEVEKSRCSMQRA